MKQTIQKQICDFIVENFLYGEPDNGLNETDSFLEKGIIDSTGILELVAFIEETYEIQIENEELIPENLDSVKNVVSFVERKLETQHA